MSWSDFSPPWSLVGGWVLAVGLIAALVAVRPASAQPEGKRGSEGEDPERVRFVSIGSQYLTGIGGLNRTLDRAGVTTTERTVLTLGVGNYAVFGAPDTPVMLGVDAQGALGFEDQPNRRDATTGALSGFGSVGFPVVSTNRVRLYPLVGLGLGATFVGFEAREDEERAVTYDDVLDNPNQRSTIVQGSLLAKGAVGVEYRYTLALADRTQRGTVGLRAGYVVDPASFDWSLGGGDDLEGGPDAGPAGPYLRLIVGGL
jgi:hypothetical protein